MNCPYCLSLIMESEKSAKCAICGTLHHAECLDANGGCAIKDCKTTPKPLEITVDDDPHTILVLSKEAVEQAPRQPYKKVSNPCMKCGTQLPNGELYCSNCEPTISEDQDSNNIGPLLVMVGIIGLVVAWVAIMSGSQPAGKGPINTTSGQAANVKR